MKKTLVAVAAIFAATGAMADATISGSIQVGVHRLDSKTTGTTVNSTLIGDKQANSNLTFSGSEDLGNGLKANFQTQFLPVTDEGGNAATYQTFAGLSGEFGSLRGGVFASPQALIIFGYDGLGAWGQQQTSINTGSVATTSAQAFFPSNQLQYSLPTFVPGLTASYTRKFGEQTTAFGDSNTYALGYTKNGFSIDYANTKMDQTVLLTNTFSGLGASYDFGMAKVAMLSTTAKIGANDTVSARGLAVTVPLGAFKVVVSSSSAGKHVSGTTITNVAQKTSEFMVGYTLSKRTSIYAISSNSTGANSAATTVNATSGSKVTQAFMLHSF